MVKFAQLCAVAALLGVQALAQTLNTGPAFQYEGNWAVTRDNPETGEVMETVRTCAVPVSLLAADGQTLRDSRTNETYVLAAMNEHTFMWQSEAKAAFAMKPMDNTFFLTTHEAANTEVMTYHRCANGARAVSGSTIARVGADVEAAPAGEVCETPVD